MRLQPGGAQGRALKDLGNAYVPAGDVSNAIDTLTEAMELHSAGRCQGTCIERSVPRGVR